MSIIFSERYIDHIQTPGHPESPERLIAIRESLKENNLWEDILEPEPATIDEISCLHSDDYIAFLQIPGERALTMDTMIHTETFDIAKLAVGGGILAAKTTWEEGKPSIALLRPPGHHAGPHSGMGFCYLNNIAIAAEQVVGKGKKIAIVDIDVHHGNGTQDSFFDRADILYISMHQQYIFPGTGPSNEVGHGDGDGYTINIPMNSGAGDKSFIFAYEKIVMPILEEYRPGILLVSIGSDAHYRDPFASLTLSTSGYLREIELLLEFAKTRCSSRISFFLEGGYDLEALTDIITPAVGMFAGKTIAPKYAHVADAQGIEKTNIDNIVKIQKNYWKLE